MEPPPARTTQSQSLLGVEHHRTATDNASCRQHEAQPSHHAAASHSTAISDEPPYSLKNELRYFLHVGVPLWVMSILKQGVPPFFAMVVAGHTSDSATLQASLGFARTLYNVVAMMPQQAMCAYFQSVLPGCIGANRADRIPRYLWRSLLLSSLLILPSVGVLYWAEQVMLAVGVPPTNAKGVGTYARYMIGTLWLTLVDSHLECVFVNLKYTWLPPPHSPA